MAKTNVAPSLKGFDDLFAPSTPIEQDSTTEPTSLLLSKLKPFDKHPFKSYNTEKLQSLSESIATQGIIMPILVRPIEHEQYAYEIIAGHNRVEASKLAGLNDIPCNIRELDDETATIIMVDSNLQQRETILPSEKAFAYKYKLEAIKSQGKRNDLTCVQVAHKLNGQKSRDLIAEKSNDSADTIRRYIRLTYLIPQLLEKVDERKLSFIPAVKVSYLREQEQKDLFDILSREEKFGIPLRQADKLKGISEHGHLPYQKIDNIITESIKNKPKNFKVSYKKVNDYFSPDTTPKEFENTILKALDEWFKKHPSTTKNTTHTLER